MKFITITSSAVLALALGTEMASAAKCSKLYGQCGGKDWNGPTCCESGSTCKVSNDYYSQCHAPESNGNKTSESAHKTTTTTALAKEITTTGIASNSSNSSGKYSIVSGGASGNGVTTRYWVCCQASCSWPGKANVSSPVKSCNKDGVVWAVSHDTYDGSYSRALAAISPRSNQFKALTVSRDGLTVSEDERVRQCKWTNCGQTCPDDYVAVSRSDPGYRKGELMMDSIDCPKAIKTGDLDPSSLESTCRHASLHLVSSLPSALQAGCKWRFNWFKNADNPSMTYKEVTCPKEITAKTGCSRK
uniref:cellulase n=1 Tax=Rhizopus reflexus TaxID=219329 RepID=A0A0H4AWF0_9FUNG|nr:endoglucanase [Rhizopus reflexus]